jgi:RNA polymerase sigma factor (sigma-70 family)
MQKTYNNLSFTRLIGPCQRSVYRVALRITRNLEDAEDIQQETLLKVHRKLVQFEGRSRFATWIHRIAINEALMCLRKRRGASHVPPFSRFEGWSAGIEKKTLQLGYYSIAGLEDICVVEQKELSDLVHSCTADRIAFVKRLKLMAAYPHRLLVVTRIGLLMEGPIVYISRYSDTHRQNLRTHEYRRFPVLPCPKEDNRTADRIPLPAFRDI